MKLRYPDRVYVGFDAKTLEYGRSCPYVSFSREKDAMAVLITGGDEPLSSVTLVWELTADEERKEPVKVLGDAWERGYGDLSWQAPDASRKMPWYCAVSNGSDALRDPTGRFTECFGVGIRPSVMAYWKYDGKTLTLVLDTRSGGEGVILGKRCLDACAVLFCEYRDTYAFDALTSFCRAMASANGEPPKTLPHPVYGSNNWYYAYGESSHDDIISDSRFVADMTKGIANRPYMVIDDGWQPNRVDAPWDHGNEKFGDMKKLASEMRACGVRPGIWVRYLINGRDGMDCTMPEIPADWRLSRDDHVLDPSHPEVIEYVRETTRRIVGWGYELIKHDFSTYDLFGRWGFEMGDDYTSSGWHFYDRSRTTAEIIVDFYRAVREEAPDAVIIGCNCVTHLCAGIHDLNRIGDDTSGFEWERTRKMGVNTLAFRAVQGAFYGADADCVGIMGKIPWKQNRLWLHVLSHSGTPLFVSCKPGILSAEETEELRDAFRHGSEQRETFVPVDWMENIRPERYLIDGKEITYQW